MTQIESLIFQDVSRHTSSSRKVLIRSKKSDNIIETQSVSLGAQLPIIYQGWIPQLLFFVYMFSQIRQMLVKDRGNIWTRKYGQHDCVHHYIHITLAYTWRVLYMDQEILQPRSLWWCPRCSSLVRFSYR